MELTMTIPEWFLIALILYFTCGLFLDLRKDHLMKKKLKLEQEKFIYEKQINQYAKAIADAKHIANSPKHSRR